MKTMYLPGLYVSQVFWPVHVKISGLFEKEFLAELPATGKFVEVGTGPGCTFTRILTERPGFTAHGFDFSPSSLEFTAALAKTLQIDPSRFQLTRGDVQKGL